MVFTINSQKLRCICRNSPSVLRRNLPARAIHSTGKGKTLLLMNSRRREAKCRETFSPPGTKLMIHMVNACPASMKRISMTVNMWKTNSLHHRGMSMFCQFMSSGGGAGSYSRVTDVNGTCPNLSMLNQHIQRLQCHHFGELPNIIWQSSSFRNTTKAEPHIRSFSSRICKSSASSLATRFSRELLWTSYHQRQRRSQTLVLPGSWYARTQSL
mmetsp:Transcript_59085/g.185423  ORF Transcript_59085/g.185423 Transcript_59085/m.185423 type:complete len:213 (+) Transcript_59085:305-943(+)